jgi:hypothetical protein
MNRRQWALASLQQSISVTAGWLLQTADWTQGIPKC